jgi:hypothetical protein
MADVRQYAGGGIEAAQRVTDSMREYQQEQERRMAQPGLYTPLEPYSDFMQRRAQEAAARADVAREVKIGARDMAGAYAARQAQGGAILGLGSIEAQELRGLAQMARAPGKMFSRSDILAIIRAERATIPAGGGEALLVQRLLSIFENLE